jgi:hypothetical protein
MSPIVLIKSAGWASVVVWINAASKSILAGTAACESEQQLHQQNDPQNVGNREHVLVPRGGTMIVDRQQRCRADET